MGSDDLFKKRKAKRIKDHQRKVACRQPYERILIVCEGEKTEPYYFQGLCDSLSLHTANVEITGNCGSSPKSVFERALEIFKESEKQRNPFDKVYCVFDKDNHSCYDETIRKITSQQPKNTFFAITSIPCFEYWLLLHFQYTTQPFNNAVSVMSKLKEFILDYEKGNSKIFQVVKDSVKFAIENARRANTEAEQNHTDNPTTLMPEIIEKLLNLKNR
ncbi:RloB family protein [Neisseria wadsworthii]|uniref:Csm2 family CRISPR-associated protein n=1 Tax=Neisseria wadsworthii 9715 TaxID=1030841 RepID=G4CND9_9NEIS|nr:RloB family protein [Neisseria wadsworthii]EGZ49953.1 Csm2 family CRISPR-associated protein [Neisseria wadsworthii 9715]QMT36575.1 RloB domain-containing protein [Neisseria wadsworthii]